MLALPIDSKKVLGLSRFHATLSCQIALEAANLGKHKHYCNGMTLNNKNKKRHPWRPRKVSSSEQLVERFADYEKYVEENPVLEDKVFRTASGIIRTKVRKDRPMTIAGFCLFLGVTAQAWRYWRKNRQDLAETIELIENIFFAYNFERAAVGIFKANIISRDLSPKRRS